MMKVKSLYGHTLNLYSSDCQLYFNKTQKKKIVKKKRIPKPLGSISVAGNFPIFGFFHYFILYSYFL